jgi:hypothetical protein
MGGGRAAASATREATAREAAERSIPVSVVDETRSDGGDWRHAPHSCSLSCSEANPARVPRALILIPLTALPSICGTASSGGPLEQRTCSMFIV